MARPTNKKDLLIQAKINYQRLADFINTISETEKLRPFSGRSLNRNLRDVLYHLHIWHEMALEWNSASKKNIKPEMPAPGFTWKTTPSLNVKIQKEGEKIELQQVLELIDSSHQEMINTISEIPHNILFEKKYYKWTGSTSVGAYFVSATSSHYDWALKFLKKTTKP